MSRLLVTLAALAVFSVSALAESLPRAAKSVRPLKYQGADICTVTSINQNKGYWLTAAHCLPGESWGEFSVDGHEVVVLKLNDVLDIAVFQTPGYRVVDLPLASEEPKMGDDITVYGHPYGFPLLKFSGKIARAEMEIPGVGLYMAYDMTIGPGNSGSSVLNEDDEVVSVAQAMLATDAFGDLTFGSPWRVLKAFAETFFRRS
jgi:S1-C subfamily serine protease